MDTTRFAFSSSTASRARFCGPETASRRSPSQTSSGPRIRKLMLASTEGRHQGMFHADSTKGMGPDPLTSALSPARKGIDPSTTHPHNAHWLATPGCHSRERHTWTGLEEGSVWDGGTTCCSADMWSRLWEIGYTG